MMHSGVGCRMDFPFKIFEVDHRLPGRGAALTTWKICYFFAQAATRSRAIGHRSIWWQGQRNWWSKTFTTKSVGD